jgi:hypothetical protein
MHGIDAMGYGANDTRARGIGSAQPVWQSGPVAMGTTAGAMVGGPIASMRCRLQQIAALRP